MHLQAFAFLSAALSFSGFAGAGAVFAFNEEARDWLLGNDWLDDYPSFTIEENPCPGFRASRSTVPDVLVVRVMPADGGHVPDAIITSLQQAVDAELPGLDVQVIRGHETVSLNHQRVQSLFVHVVTDGTLEAWDERAINGFYCKGHIVQSAFVDHPHFTQAVFLHEFGHYLGMCHEDGTWMRQAMGASGIPEDARRWSETQHDVIERWQRSGSLAPPVCTHR